MRRLPGVSCTLPTCMALLIAPQHPPSMTKPEKRGERAAKNGGRAMEERWKSIGRASKTHSPDASRASLHYTSWSTTCSDESTTCSLRRLWKKLWTARAELWTARAKLWSARAEQLQQLQALLGELPGALTIRADLKAACEEGGGSKGEGLHARERVFTWHFMLTWPLVCCWCFSFPSERAADR